MRTTLIGMIVLMNVFSFSFALADNETIDGPENPMIISAPVENTSVEVEDNETVSDGQIFWKKIRIAFTFNQEKKAEYELRLAEMQLIRARIAARNNNTNVMINALKAHQELITKVQGRVSKFDEKRNSTEKVVGIERAIQTHEAKIARLNNLVANNPNLTTEQVTKIHESITRTETNTQHLKSIAKAKLDKLELRRLAINASENRIRERAQEMTEVINDSGEQARERIRQRIESRTNNGSKEESD